MKTAEEVMKEEMDRKDMMIRKQADTIMAQKSEIEQQSELLGESKSCTLLWNELFIYHEPFYFFDNLPIFQA